MAGDGGLNLRAVEGGATAPRGFAAEGVHCGIKRRRPDLALLVSQRPAAAAGTFTTNVVQAAPVVVTREHVASGRLKAVVANSGNANACTGEAGLADARRMARLVAEAVGAEPEEVAVASTGVIGVPLPMDRVAAGIAAAAAGLSPDKGERAARALMTTDTEPKQAAVRLTLGGRSVTVGGMAKGSGMIHPDMATMLAFVTTDAPVAPDALRRLLSRSVDRTYNRITVDGDTSTNDMVVALANGAAGGPLLQEGDADLAALARAFDFVNERLAKAIARDGEGATKLVEVRVRGARSEAEALQVAKTVAGSSLVKTAVYGRDANWGRLLAAAGRAGVDFDPHRVEAAIGDVVVVRGGVGAAFDEDRARAALEGPEVVLTLDLGEGSGRAEAWTCDMTEKYIEINASYRT